jgi:hypothetical protein
MKEHLSIPEILEDWRWGFVGYYLGRAGRTLVTES